MQVDKNPSVPLKKAAELSGLTPHMLVYLSRTEILVPTGNGPPKRGRQRRYTFSDVIFLQVIADLLSRGIEVKRLSVALKRAKGDVDGWIDIRKAPRHFLFTDGTEVFVQKKGRLESKTVNRQLAFAFLIDIADAHRKISSAWPDQQYLTA